MALYFHFVVPLKTISCHSPLSGIECQQGDIRNQKITSNLGLR